MDFFVILSVAVIMTSGIFKLTPEPIKWVGQRYRLKPIRRFGDVDLRHTLRKTAQAAGKYLYGFRTRRKNENIHREIFSALSVLRNYAAAENVTTDYLLENFAGAEGQLRDAYSGALRLLRTGRRSEAIEFFSASAPVQFARDFILLILDWDAIDPSKQKQTIASFQNALKEVRTTELTRRNEIISDLVYLPVVAGVLIIFVNFIYIAYFAEQHALLSELFY